MEDEVEAEAAWRGLLESLSEPKAGWTHLLEAAAAPSPSPATQAAFTQLRRLVLAHGAPPSVRGELWASAGAARARAQPGDHYEQLCAACERAHAAAADAKRAAWSGDDARAEPEPLPGGLAPLVGHERERWEEAAAQIDKDLPRTFAEPSASHAASPLSPVLGLPPLNASSRTALRRVLCAYAYADPGLGYTQGMNFIAAQLLEHSLTESAAFWTLCAVTQDILAGYFTPTMASVNQDGAMLASLAERRLPGLPARLSASGFPLQVLVTPWLLTAFANSLPPAPLARLWDMLLLERKRTCLFALSLHLLSNIHSALRESEAAPPDAAPLSPGSRTSMDAERALRALHGAGTEGVAGDATGGAMLQSACSRFSDVTWELVQEAPAEEGALDSPVRADAPPGRGVEPAAVSAAFAALMLSEGGAWEWGKNDAPPVAARERPLRGCMPRSCSPPPQPDDDAPTPRAGWFGSWI